MINHPSSQGKLASETSGGKPLVKYKKICDLEYN